MKKCLFSLCIAFTCFAAVAQNGKLVAQKPYTIADSNATRLKTIMPEVDSVIKNITFSAVTYLSDGLKINGYVAAPKQSGKYPCVIYNRGGNRDFGALEDMQLVLFLGRIASWGYVVVGSQYRGNKGSEGKEEFGGSDVNDILNLLPFLAGLPNTDTSRIGMYGWSRGGMMTYLALAKTNKIKAAVIGSGTANMFTNIQKRPEMDSFVLAELVPDYLRSKEAALKQRSAVYWADKICKTTPLLVMHGSADWRVLPDEAFEMADKLYKARHPFRFVFFEGGQHSLREHNSEVFRLSEDFLDTYVRDKKQWPSLEPHGN